MHSSDTLLDKKSFEEIRQLEESLWRAVTRFDNMLMDEIFAKDFFEFGRSGRTYFRDEMLFDTENYHEIQATLPLPKFHARYLTKNIVQTTYVSEVIVSGAVQCGNRSSIWSYTDGSWQLALAVSSRNAN